MDQEAVPPFSLALPSGEGVPVVLSSPHSGRVYPRSVLAQLRIDAPALRALDDGPIDKLAQAGCAQGAALIAARYPRVVIDLNREPDELDPDLLQDAGALPDLRVTAKARAGLGLVPSRVAGQAIWRQRLLAEDVRRRLAQVFHPYHAALAELLRERRERFGAAVLLDCHSMPGQHAFDGVDPRLDVALGDRFGHSCAAELTAAAEAAFRRAGLKVARNQPYAGGYITGCHGRPQAGVSALQIELRRGLFMDEATHVPHAGFAVLQGVMADLVGTMAAASRALAPLPLAPRPLAPVPLAPVPLAPVPLAPVPLAQAS